MTLWLIGALSLFGVGVLAYALVIGFPVPGTGQVEAVALTDEEDRHDLLVRVTVGEPGCQELTGIDVTETRQQVALVAQVAIPHGTRLDFSCPEELGTAAYHTVRLNSPLGERTVTDEDREVEVEVLGSMAELLTHDR